jgi:hypothetical protein
MRYLSTVSVWVCCVAVSLGVAKNTPQAADDGDKPRVFITDSQSWEIGGQSGGGGGAFASRMGGGARPQTAEIVKTFGQRCPQVVTNNIQQKADYIVVLDHEGGKSFVRHKNKVAVFARISGDSVISKSTVSLGGSVQEACDAITKDWPEHGKAMRDAAAAEAKTAATPAAPAAAAPIVVPVAATTGKLSIASVPDAADIEVDGGFVGNTPSDLQLAQGEHTITVKKPGFKDWERKLKVNAGSSVRLNAELEKPAGPAQ